MGDIRVEGPTGVGKSFLASALAQKACRDGYSVYYTRAAALFHDLNMADAILDRLVHNAHRIEMRGESMRKQRGDTKA